MVAGMTTNEADYELCFRAERVQLPRGGVLGVSAATGGLADDHDVLHLVTSSLHSTLQGTHVPACPYILNAKLIHEKIQKIIVLVRYSDLDKFGLYSALCCVE